MADGIRLDLVYISAVAGEADPLASYHGDYKRSKDYEYFTE